ncbi:MAG: tetratricopeptide repeat protein [Desulfobacteraceae bacterium]
MNREIKMIAAGRIAGILSGSLGWLFGQVNGRGLVLGFFLAVGVVIKDVMKRKINMIAADEITGILSGSFLKEKKMNKKCTESIGTGRGHMAGLRFCFGMACFALWLAVFCFIDLLWTTKAMAEEVRTYKSVYRGVEVGRTAHDDVVQVLGEPRNRSTQAGYIKLYYQDVDITVNNNTGKVNSIIIYDPSYLDSNGIRVGSSRELILSRVDEKRETTFNDGKFSWITITDFKKGISYWINAGTGKLEKIVLAHQLRIPGSKEKSYGNYDPMRILHTSDNGRHSLDMRYLDIMIAGLIEHAGSYPVRFDSVFDRQRAAKDVWQLSGMLDILVKEPKPIPDILLRSGIVNSIGHNLDIKGTPQRASEAFDKLLAIDSSHAQGNYWYGVFLSGSGRPKMALPFLRKAISAGVTDAYYTMGLTVLSLGEKDKALEYLETYRQKKPGDSRTSVLIEKIRNGKITITKN